MQLIKVLSAKKSFSEIDTDLRLWGSDGDREINEQNLSEQRRFIVIGGKCIERSAASRAQSSCLFVMWSEWKKFNQHKSSCKNFSLVWFMFIWLLSVFMALQSKCYRIDSVKTHFIVGRKANLMIRMQLTESEKNNFTVYLMSSKWLDAHSIH